jgi:3-phenylpropionate/trans-cinnamate dioxygenase ferredoxin reductase component
MARMVATIVIVGGGQAGAQAVDTLRREGFRGRLVLVCDESLLPYQRPPLSKKFLSGEMAAERLLFRHRAFYDEHGVELKLGARAAHIVQRRGKPLRRAIAVYRRRAAAPDLPRC